MKKRVLIMIGILVFIAILVAVLFGKRNVKKEYKNWNDYVINYSNKSIKIKNKDSGYSEKFNLKDRVIYDEKEQAILTNVVNVYSINYEGQDYIYLIDAEGKTYYMNNIKDSTQEQYELTELGDYKNIVEISVRDKKIVARDINSQEYELNEKMKNYVGYSY